VKKIVLLFLLNICHSASAGWVYVAGDVEDRSWWEYDPSRFVRKGDMIEFWLRQSGSEHTATIISYLKRSNAFSIDYLKDLERKHSYDLSKWRVRCQSFEMAVIYVQRYDYKGIPLDDSVKGNPNDFSPIIPESMMDSTASKLCKKNK
jgi:hypothetical protein